MSLKNPRFTNAVGYDWEIPDLAEFTARLSNPFAVHPVRVLTLLGQAIDELAAFADLKPDNLQGLVFNEDLAADLEKVMALVAAELGKMALNVGLDEREYIEHWRAAERFGHVQCVKPAVASLVGKVRRLQTAREATR